MIVQIPIKEEATANNKAMTHECNIQGRLGLWQNTFHVLKYLM